VDILTAVGFVLALVAVLVGAVLKGAGICAHCCRPRRS
jgi:flagellar motor component MotA